jgi:hypothetical protein
VLELLPRKTVKSRRADLKGAQLTSVISLAFLFSFAQAKLPAQDLGIVTQVDCESFIAPSCGVDSTIKAAAEDYERVGDKLPSDSLRMFTGGAHDICDATWQGALIWVPSERIKNGSEAAATLVKLAQTGKVLGDNQVIVTASGSKSEEQHLALCSVHRISNVSGPPEDCVTVAIITPSRNWLLAVYPGHNECTKGISVRLTGAIQIDFEVRTAIRAGAFADSLTKRLQSESDYGLGLTVKEDSNGRNSDHAYIDSVAGMRHSRVFQGRWWDILEFNLHLKSDDTGKKVFISGTANVIVSEVNAPNLVAFHGLDDRQRQEYAKRLSDEVTKAIQMTCKHFNQLDATTIECN